MVVTVSKAADIGVSAKDFVETSEGLIFAVVESGLEQGQVLCFLRYIKSEKQWKKLNTEQANQLLTEQYSHYLHYSAIKQAHCHALNLDQVFKYHHPKARIKQLIAAEGSDIVESDCISLCLLFQENGLAIDQIGVTGSILISAQKQSSDIDLVFYSRESFNKARQITQLLIEQGKCSALTEPDWLESYDRRCCELSYSEYVWHEKRKFNKAMINQRKFDLSLVNVAVPVDNQISYKKRDAVVIKVQVTDDALSFDYPAEFSIKHPNIDSVVCYTATYTGQAKMGEWIEVAGLVEESSDGCQRIVVGSTREAGGEYIKVINE